MACPTRSPAPPGAVPRPELLTLAVLEDVAAVLARHGFPPLRGYPLAELTPSLYRLQGSGEEVDGDEVRTEAVRPADARAQRLGVADRELVRDEDGEEVKRKGATRERK